MISANGPFYYPKYEEYTRIISPEARTIGIVTQPFSQEDGVNARTMDKIEVSGDRCRLLVMGLVDYMQAKFPKAEIDIRNGPGETVALAYARLIMANQSLGIIPSTFSTFPVLSSFGTGYLTKPQREGIFNKRTQGLYPDMPVEVDISAPNMLYNKKLNQWFSEENGAEKVLTWFQNDTDRSSTSIWT